MKVSEAESEAGERSLRADVDGGRDADILQILAGLVDRSTGEFASAQGALRGFVAYLAAIKILALARPFLSGPSSISSTVAIFTRASEVIDGMVARELNTIAKECLSTIVLLKQVLDQNQSTLDTITKDLQNVPTEPPSEAAARIEALIQYPKESRPTYERAIGPSEIISLSKEAEGVIVGLERQIAASMQELERTSSLANGLKTVRDSILSSLDRMRALKEKYAKLLRDSLVVWPLLAEADKSPWLGELSKRLCSSLIDEAQRRTGTPAIEFVNGIQTSEFLVSDAQRLLDNHIVAKLLRKRDELSIFIQSSQARKADIAAVRDNIIQLPSKRTKQFRASMKWIAVLSLVPVLNVVSGVWSAIKIQKYKEAIGSSLGDYVHLRSIGIMYMTLSLISVLLSTAFLYAFSGTIAKFANLEPYTVELGILIPCALTCCLLFYNLFVLNFRSSEGEPSSNV